MNKEDILWDKRAVDHGEPEGIVLGGIFSIHQENEQVVFMEQCDHDRRITLTKKEAVDRLKEAIEYIEGFH